MKATQFCKRTFLVNAVGFLVAVGFIGFNLRTARAGQVDPRFDGTWAGVETFPAASTFTEWAQGMPQYCTVISISNSAQVVRVISGFVPGRYWVDSKSNGNMLIFHGNNGRQGRNLCRLELSADGNTLKESGIAVFSIRPVVDGFSNRPVRTTTSQVYATFHRVGK